MIHGVPAVLQDGSFLVGFAMDPSVPTIILLSLIFLPMFQLIGPSSQVRKPGG